MPAIDPLLRDLVDLEGSDLHLVAGHEPMARVHGTMRSLGNERLTPEKTESLLGEITPGEFNERFKRTHDVDFGYQWSGGGRFRVNVFMNRRGVAGVLRVIPDTIPSFRELNLPAVLERFVTLPKGIVLVTGPTGSGKSTTLAAIIDEINRTRGAHIITIEDPIEFVHENKSCLVNQREVGSHTESFSKALRAALRQDPDVILVGEMRDLETTRMALEAAETGHLVFSTLHTSSAATTIDRIVDQFPEGSQAQIRTMLAATLQGVVAQSLLRRKDASGRVAALEVLVSTPAVAANIREGKTHQIPSAMQTGGRLGMVLLNDALVRLVCQGTVDPAEAYEKVTDKEGLLRAFQTAGINFNYTQAKGTKMHTGTGVS